MINEKVIITARQLVGQHLKNIRKEKKLTFYAVAKQAEMSIEQVQGVESGKTAYTFDSFLKITHALNCYFFLEDKNGKHLDFADMAEKAISKKGQEKILNKKDDNR